VSIPSENKNQVTRTREEPDPAAFSAKSDFDQSKAGLQDDHDPRDQQNDVPEGIRDKQHGVQNPPMDDQKGEQKKQPGQQY
jgi:hypothetical protein